ncbi:MULTISPECIES: glycosyltransferase family 4 protein [Methylosinus]|uniref:Glycosyltransferase family 1 protein n=1 Tax=Methylosinus trichosporium (strain ATCC 35070 / NCIMB 11131 / UNIQEM 75 / OB3b) TaxID=595536 RepID=A0A2D2CX62_METT3|nr:MULTISPECIES: glycosyltransferase family 4 protein [Methylosinus]ATQ67266.1 glycosyltransferase family 1 protein [Methylosinus trichosporium OB3b]OBS52584.1 glycosyl transferase group 1 [Methylosinus sp. 3S-1]
MTARRETGDDKLRILHVMRAPIGGLFRHVVDLAGEQAARGHKIGLIVDSTTGNERAETVLRRLEPALALGVTRIGMRREPHWSDAYIACRIAAVLRRLEPDVVHGHGAKGGLYARLPALLPFFPSPKHPLIRVYTPHGGTLHYDPDALAHRLYLAVEAALERVTDFIPFESAFAQARFCETIGVARALTRVVPNGLRRDEFAPVAPADGAADFLYVGEWRRCKGVDTLIEALALVGAQTGAAPRLALVGSGPDEAALRMLAERRGVFGQLTFRPPTPAREALRLGHILVVPSRAESLPYIVLEAIAAGAPLVATRVGGIPEIFGPFADRLVPRDDPSALAAAMIRTRDAEPQRLRSDCDALAARVAETFSLEAMTESVVRGYRDALATTTRRSRADAATAPQKA